MTTCCPNCPSMAIGTEAASICTECASVSVAGASFSMPLMVASVAGAMAIVFAWKAIREASRRPARLALA